MLSAVSAIILGGIYRQMAEQKIQPKQAKEDETFRYFVRVSNTDLNGSHQIINALRKIKGVNFMFSNMVCNAAGIDKLAKAGTLTDEQVKKIDEVIANPARFNVPSWILNRRKSYDDGKDYHIIGGNLSFAEDNDIKRMKKTRSYKGIRHGLGLPVRGQRTRSNFRKNKGKVTLGVIRKKVVPQSDKKSDKD